jgi:hypothetical protein
MHPITTYYFAEDCMKRLSEVADQASKGFKEGVHEGISQIKTHWMELGSLSLFSRMEWMKKVDARKFQESSKIFTKALNLK